MTFIKLGLDWHWEDTEWHDYYQIGKTNILDAAVLWKQNSYIPGTQMCLSFQKRKHLGLGRGGMILLDDFDSYKKLIRMSYDGRDRNVLWAEQDIETVGYHYYMTPEAAQHGLEKFNQVKTITPTVWSNLDYPDLSTLKVFANVK